MLKPKLSGSDFYNYKGYYSVVLLAFVDYDYRFLAADVGIQGRIMVVCSRILECILP